MPGKDGTGPAGKGSKTGKGKGNCKTNNTEPKNPLGFGRGRKNSNI